MAAPPPVDRYEFRLAVGGPYHAEYLRIPRDWDELPTFAAGVYRRVRVAAERRDPCVGSDLLLHESVAEDRLDGPYRHAVARVRALGRAS